MNAVSGRGHGTSSALPSDPDVQGLLGMAIDAMDADDMPAGLAAASSLAGRTRSPGLHAALSVAAGRATGREAVILGAAALLAAVAADVRPDHGRAAAIMAEGTALPAFAMAAIVVAIVDDDVASVVRAGAVLLGPDGSCRPDAGVPGRVAPMIDHIAASPAGRDHGRLADLFGLVGQQASACPDEVAAAWSPHAGSPDAIRSMLRIAAAQGAGRPDWLRPALAAVDHDRSAAGELLRVAWDMDGVDGCVDGVVAAHAFAAIFGSGPGAPGRFRDLPMRPAAAAIIADACRRDRAIAAAVTETILMDASRPPSLMLLAALSGTRT